MLDSSAEAKLLDIIYRFSDTFDFIDRNVNLPDRSLRVLFLSNICDISIVEKKLLKPFYESNSRLHFHDYVATLIDCKEVTTQQVSDSLLWKGYILFVSDFGIYTLKASKSVTNTPEQPIESVILGPNLIFKESTGENLAAIRKLYRSETLKAESLQVGNSFKLELMFLYDEAVVDHDTLEQLKLKFEKANNQRYMRIDQLRKLAAQNKWTIFPTVMMTQRLDRTIKNLQEGRIVFMVEGDTSAFIVPSFFTDFFAAMDDFYELSFIGQLMLGLRLIAFTIAVSLPSIYIVVTSYNPELLRVELAMSISGSRVLVPYPSFIEVLFMLLMMELLSEASIRLPRIVGPAGTTVGGLILGQAATQAGLASNIMVIIISAVAISNFVIPIGTMSMAIRVIRYILLVASTLFGFIGLVGCCVVLVFYTVNLPNYGQPYWQLFPGIEKKKRDRRVV